MANDADTNLLTTRFTIKDKEFDVLRHLVKAKTGISLGLHKKDLVVSRLSQRLRALGIPDFSGYIKYLENDDSGNELVQMINRITTNKTDFFRENHHFEFLTNKLLPQLWAEGEKKGQRVLRLWSAGCSSGEEPYTLAITLREFFSDKPGWDVRMLASDLDTTMLTRASQGIYDEHQLSPVAPALLRKYFDKLGDGTYQAGADLKKLITFRKFNLMHPQYPAKPAMDFIFCRNVMIYFETEEKVSIMTKFHQALKPGGHLFIGHSESAMMVKELYTYVGTTIYRKI